MFGYLKELIWALLIRSSVFIFQKNSPYFFTVDLFEPLVPEVSSICFQSHLLRSGLILSFFLRVFFDVALLQSSSISTDDLCGLWLPQVLVRWGQASPLVHKGREARKNAKRREQPVALGPNCRWPSPLRLPIPTRFSTTVPLWMQSVD